MEKGFLNKFDENVEDGEISDTFDPEMFEPLPRSVSLAINSVMAAKSALNCSTTTNSNNSPSMGVDDKVDMLVNEDSVSDVSSLTDDSSDTCLKAITAGGSRPRRTKRTKRGVMVRIQSTDNSAEQHDAKFKRYRRMAAAWEDEALAENMRECDVTHHNRMKDGGIEGYDVSLHHKLYGENCLKRCFSNTADGYSNRYQRKEQPYKKKARISFEDDCDKFRKPVHDRIGWRQKQRSRSQSPSAINTDKSYYKPRYLEDMNDVHNRDALDIAQEMAHKLKEKECDLLAKIIETLGVETTLTFYKETQRIEAIGGLEIMNGTRRRTSGGVLFSLIKRDEAISDEIKKNIFGKYEQLFKKKQKARKNAIRNRKVEELKKRLSEQSSELALLQTNIDYVMDTVDEKAQDGNLLNPPPSPEPNDFNCININQATMELTSNTAQDQQPSSSNADDATSVTERVIPKFDYISDAPCGDMEL